MKRKLVAALLGLAIGGCAQSRSMRPPEGPGSQPIGVDPVPSIHETINRGTNPAVARTALPNPADPNWSGISQPERPPATGLAPRVATTEPPANFQANPKPAAASPANPPSPPPSLEPDTPRTALGDPAGNPAAAAQFGDVRNHAEPPGLDPVDAAPPRTALGDPAMSPSADADGLDDALPPVMEADDASLPPVSEAAAPLEPTAQPAPAPQPRPAEAPMEEDPLLGPNPDLMPAMDDLVPNREAAAAKADDPAPAPIAKPAADLDLDLDLDPDAPVKAGEPSPVPAAEPAPTPTPAPVPDLDLDLEPGAPADSAEAPALPDLSPAPEGAEPPELPPAVEPSAGMFPATPQSQALAARSPAPRVDPTVRRVSAAPPSTPADHVADDPNLIEAGRTAARVGDEVITLRELVVAVKDQVARHGGKISQIPANELNMIAQTILAGLIERSLLVQEAKRQLKDKKQLDRIHEAADKYWKESELPPLLRQYMVENEYQLKEKLSESGRSLEALRQNYVQDFICQIFVHQKLSDKMNVELPEMLKYYNEHIKDKENQRVAQIVWREVLVENGRHPSPADARRKADDLLARLKAGEDFAKLAIAESEGPALIKSQGGLMTTAPGSYAVAAVNQAIETLPPGEISGIIEGPSSLHIVRVESRRAAGPATFSELQDQIRQRLTMEKMNRERETLLAKLRANTIVTTIFDGTASDPNQALNR